MNTQQDYVSTRVRLARWDEDTADFLAAWLGDLGYESFVQEEPWLVAYIGVDQYDRQEVEQALATFPMSDVIAEVRHEIVPGRDWNEEWEKHYFKPIIVTSGGGCAVVHSSFHKDIPQADYDIVVDPKMAFGTGHHATTRLMMSYLLETDLRGLTVVDMGTGTGILAILAMMRGAACVTGIEIDPGAHANALENASLNGVAPVLLCGDASALEGVEAADLFLANINRNVILADVDLYAKCMKPGATLVCSGFHAADIPLLERAGKDAGLESVLSAADGEWMRLIFRKSSV